VLPAKGILYNDIWKIQRFRKFNSIMRQVMLKTKLGTLLAVLTVLLSGLAGCNSATRVQSQDPNFRFTRGKEYFEQGKYYKAIDDFNFVVLNNPGDTRADDAQLFIADAHYEVKEYMVAASEYRRLIQKYPESALVEQARYKLGLCLVQLSPDYQLEQQYTEQAMNTLQGFLEDYPASKYKEEVTKLIGELRGKMAHKIYSNAHLYYVLHHYESAVIYCDQLLNNYYDTPWANPTRLEKAKSLVKLDRSVEARTLLEDLLSRNPKQQIQENAKQMIEELQPSSSAITQAKGME